jgi:hypothetical protein
MEIRVDSGDAEPYKEGCPREEFQIEPILRGAVHFGGGGYHGQSR